MMKIGNSPRFSVQTRLQGTIPSRPDKFYLSLFVNTFTDQTLEVHLPPQSTVDDLKDVIQDIEGIPEDQIRLIFCGKQLVGNRPLATHNMVSGSTVHLVRPLRGGGGGPLQSFVDMENMSSLKTYKLRPPSEMSKPWRLVSHGLNIRGVCRIVECKARGCNVWCNKGYTVFNLAESVQCPSCRKHFTATTCGFWGCQWMFEGRKSVSSIDIMSKWNVTGEEDFQWFDDAGGHNTADWSSLVITVKRLPGTGSYGPEYVGKTDCVLCFGPTYASNTVATCGHAVHSECVREFVRAGYSTCPTCRLPLGHGQAGITT